MARGKAPADRPDAIVYREEDGQWYATCLLCPRTLTQWSDDRRFTWYYVREHLKYSHGLDRIWVDEHTYGYKQMVQDALPLIVAHDLQVASEYRPR